jgi:phage FluMu gp28-like protein
MKPATTQQNSCREYRQHRLTILKRAVNGLGNRLIDRRTATGKALAKWRADLIRDLGEDVSTQESAIVDLAVKSS